jgi:N-acetylmuramoyl-L-alanine amidase
MPLTHVVRPGEHLGAIAKQYGFENFSMLWELPENAELKRLREDPALLAPGDELFIPDRVRLVFNRITDASHDVKVKLDRLQLNLRVLDIDGEPYKNAAVTIRVEPPKKPGASFQTEKTLTTDGEGKLSVDIAKHVRAGSLLVDGVEFPLDIGKLDPIDTQAGVAQRLHNLGYLAPRDLDRDGEIDAAELELAIRDFQADHTLESTGQAKDIETKLEEVYGS